MHSKNDILASNKNLASASINNKSAIFVGPADSLEGQGQGAIIDKYDFVIRTNGGFKLADKYPEDYGSKCDILYINNFWFRKHVAGCSKSKQTQYLKRLLRGDIKFIILKAPGARKLPDWMVRLEAPKFFIGGRIPMHAKLRQVWKVDEKLTEPLQTTHAIYNMLQFKAKNIAITGIDFYEGEASWHKAYNSAEVNEAAHREARNRQHSLIGDKKFIRFCIRKNWLKADTRIKQILHLEELDVKFEAPRP